MDHREHIDEFESMFKAAEREPFVFADIPVNSIALVTDGTPAQAEELKATIQGFLPRLESAENWRFITNEDYDTVSQLLECVDGQQTDLVVTYRHLQEEALIPQHSLGVYLDVLTQAATIPVLLLPGTASEPISLEKRTCVRAMVVTDHISGDNRLINYGVRMCSTAGTIWLCHVEDQTVFERYIRVIGRIPEIDTEQARTLIERQLTKDAADFIETCMTVLRENGPNVTYRSTVGFGHHLREYRSLIDNHEIDLLVANTKDEDQLAMHGITYSLSVEFTDVPMLLL